MSLELPTGLIGFELRITFVGHLNASRGRVLATSLSQCRCRRCANVSQHRFHHVGPNGFLQKAQIHRHRCAFEFTLCRLYVISTCAITAIADIPWVVRPALDLIGRASYAQTKEAQMVVGKPTFIK